jgi:hypothetical protein
VSLPCLWPVKKTHVNNLSQMLQTMTPIQMAHFDNILAGVFMKNCMPRSLGWQHQQLLPSPANPFYVLVKL